jgi:hypothetical protein
VDYVNNGVKHVARVREYTEPEIRKISEYVGFTYVTIDFKGDDMVIVGCRRKP